MWEEAGVYRENQCVQVGDYHTLSLTTTFNHGDQTWVPAVRSEWIVHLSTQVRFLYIYTYIYIFYTYLCFWLYTKYIGLLKSGKAKCFDLLSPMFCLHIMKKFNTRCYRLHIAIHDFFFYWHSTKPNTAIM